MNQLENCQARYRSNTRMGRTCTDGPDEFEPSKFDCIYQTCDLALKLLSVNLVKLRGEIRSSILFDTDGFSERFFCKLHKKYLQTTG